MVLWDTMDLLVCLKDPASGSMREDAQRLAKGNPFGPDVTYHAAALLSLSFRWSPSSNDFCGRGS